MAVGQYLIKSGGELCLRIRICIERRSNTIRHQCLKASP